MPVIIFEGKDYDCRSDETLLDSLTRHGVLLSSGCRGGSCHSCLVKAVKGLPPVDSQCGLKDTLVSQHYFLPCICKPEEDMTIGLADSSLTFHSEVLEKRWLNESVFLLRLSKPDGFTYQPGQFINLQQNDSKLVRSYSLASVQSENFLDLHIKRVPEGKMSSWLADQLNVGDSISFFGPSGNCFYLPGDQSQPLILAGTGTGLAPLYGIIRDALNQNHQGPINLFHASLATEGLYYMEELSSLASQYEQVTYYPCVLHGDAPEGGLVGAIDKLIPVTIKDCKGCRAYLCGDAPIVEAMQRTIFFAGASMQDIYADAFHITPQS